MVAWVLGDFFANYFTVYAALVFRHAIVRTRGYGWLFVCLFVCLFDGVSRLCVPPMFVCVGGCLEV